MRKSLILVALIALVLTANAAWAAEPAETTAPPAEPGSCLSLFIDLTAPETSEALAESTLIPTGTPIVEWSGVNKKISTQWFSVIDNETMQATSGGTMTCKATCTGNGCGVSGCDISGTTCSSCSCDGFDCSLCTCSKTVTGGLSRMQAY
jgi:hypothetical protein